VLSGIVPGAAGAGRRYDERLSGRAWGVGWLCLVADSGSEGPRWKRGPCRFLGGAWVRGSFLQCGSKSASPRAFPKPYRFDNPEPASWADPSTIHATGQGKPVHGRVGHAAPGHVYPRSRSRPNSLSLILVRLSNLVRLGFVLEIPPKPCGTWLVADSGRLNTRCSNTGYSCLVLSFFSSPSHLLYTLR
jgi:hypothetical protein